MKQTCLTCKYGTSEYGNDVIICHRFPDSGSHYTTFWCGEWKETQAKSNNHVDKTEEKYKTCSNCVSLVPSYNYTCNNPDSGWKKHGLNPIYCGCWSGKEAKPPCTGCIYYISDIRCKMGMTPKRKIRCSSWRGKEESISGEKRTMNIVIKNVTQRQMERFHLNVTHTLNQFLEDDVKDIYLSFDSDHLPTWFVGVKEKEGS